MYQIEMQMLRSLILNQLRDVNAGDEGILLQR
jgi:hypothetical protein